MSSSNNNNSQYFQTAGQQEAERLDRMTNEHYRRGNAKIVSESIKNYNSSSSTKCSSRGSKLHLHYITEQARKSLLDNPEQLRASKAQAMEIAALIKKSGYQTLSPYYQGLKRNTKQQEEKERLRRIKDVDECRARKVNALKASEAIRVDSGIIKARFIRRGPSIKAWKKDIVHKADKIHLMPTGVKHAFSSFLQKASSIKDNLVHSVQNVIKGDSISLPAIKLLEEGERQRRIAEDKTGFAQGNAKRVSQLLHIAKFPSLSHSSKGFNSFTSSIEERERVRRLANKFECEARRTLAGEVAHIINQLGWPFITSAKNAKFSHPSCATAEAERARRLSDKSGLVAARIQANKIAKLVGDAILPRNKAFAFAYTRAMEDQERRYRAKHAAKYAVHNAHREAKLIADIGGIFYKPTHNRTYGVQKQSKVVAGVVGADGMKWNTSPMYASQAQLEQQKKARITAKKVQKQSDNKVITNKQSKLLQEQAEQFNLFVNTKLLEEGERKYRLANKELEHQAKVNANNVARLIKKQNPYSTSSTTNKAAAPLKLKKTASKKPEFSLWAKKLDLPQPAAASAGLIATVQRLYDLEVKLAENAQQKTSSVVASGLFGSYRSNTFAATAAKHNANAQRHLQWLQEARGTTAASTVAAPLAAAAAPLAAPPAAKFSEIVQSPSIQRAARAAH